MHSAHLRLVPEWVQPPDPGPRCRDHELAALPLAPTTRTSPTPPVPVREADDPAHAPVPDPLPRHKGRLPDAMPTRTDGRAPRVLPSAPHDLAFMVTGEAPLARIARLCSRTPRFTGPAQRHPTKPKYMCAPAPVQPLVSRRYQ